MIQTNLTYQVFQRNRDRADIPWVGYGIGDIEARFNGCDWQTIVQKSDGLCTGTFLGATQGQGTFESRIVGSTDVASSDYVGVGDLFLCCGQSNMMGMGYSKQTYSHPSLKAGLFGNDGVWKELVDPYDSSLGQVDTVSRDSGAWGSFVPSFATTYLADQNLPCGFVPAAKASTSITQWQPGAYRKDRSTLYGNAVYRALQCGGVRAVLWWQGERDATYAMSRVDYTTYLTTLANAFYQDLGVPTVVVRLQNCTGINSTSLDDIRSAREDAMLLTRHVLAGPDFSDLASDDIVHLRTNAKLQTAGARFYAAYKTAYDAWESGI